MTALLSEAGGAVRIEDILPLFPDFVEIDAFKDAICRQERGGPQGCAGLTSGRAAAVAGGAAVGATARNESLMLQTLGLRPCTISPPQHGPATPVAGIPS